MMQAMIPPGLSPVQAAVQIIQNMLQCGMSGVEYERNLRDLHGLMADYAFAGMRHSYELHLRETNPDYVLTIEEVTSEENENTPMAEAYWAGTSAFYRKVYQALAAAA
jgi:hypothetical protein